MTWNHRVCKSTASGQYAHGETWESITYGIHEVYYNSNGDIYAITEEPTRILTDKYDEECTEADCIGALEDSLVRMQKCLSKPIIDLSTIKFAEPD